jgi:two-component system sensor histidine kinase RpfC
VSAVVSRLRRHFANLRARLAVRPDSEHEQAIVRVVVVAVLCAYLLPGALAGSDEATIKVMFAYLATSIVLLLLVLASPGISPARRVAAMVSDIAVVTWCMAFLGEHAVPLVLVYVWITLANGFRFGQRYLLMSLGMSVAGMLFVLAVNDFWQQHRALGYGLLVGTIALSLYVRSLVRKLFEALARAEAANQAKRRFISVVSHEMRTPLNAIIGMADLLRDTPLNREQADMLQTLRSSSRMMLGLVEDVLDFSKIEAGKVVLEKVDFDLHALVNSTCRILSAQAAGKGIDFVISIMPEVPPAVRGDPHYLRQVLVNLAGNAIKFTERGSVTVHVSAQSETEREVCLKFSIRDTGIGIPPEAQSRIFESFAQADQSTTRRFGGTGLGTTIAKQLVGLMGGKMGLESAVGLGSTFWFEAVFEKQPERAQAGGDLADARVLLLGVPAADAEQIGRALAGWGAVSVSVATIDEGVARLVSEIALAKPYHSVLFYGAGDNRELAQRFRRAAPNPTPPMILAVPQGADVARFEALTSGFSAVLDLPLDKRRLFNVLHSVSAGDEPQGSVVRLQDYARRGAARKLRLLVADDNPTNREVLQKILERGGHEPVLVADGEQVLDVLERDRFDMAILDRNMPGLGGIEALQAIRVLTSATERIPVVILSADATLEAKREAFEAGADAFLTKPIEAMKLLDQIQSLCASAGAERKESRPPSVAPVRPIEAQPAGVINRETIGQLEELGSSPSFVEKLIAVFITDSESLLARAEHNLVARNPQEFRGVLHAMKGSSASMGTDRLTALCSSLGKLSDAEMRLQSAGILQSLRAEIEAARSELERYLRQRRSSSA